MSPNNENSKRLFLWKNATSRTLWVDVWVDVWGFMGNGVSPCAEWQHKDLMWPVLGFPSLMVDEPQHGLRRQHSLCCEMFRDRSLEEMIRGQDSRLVLETSEPSLGVPIWTFFCLWFFGCSSQLCTNSLWTEVCFDWIHKDRAGLDSDVDTFGNAGVGYEAETLATVGEKKRSFSSDMNPVKL